jgi:bifunctional non-homologous end joining protein LigD
MLICASAPFEFDDDEPVMVAGFIMKSMRTLALRGWRKREIRATKILSRSNVRKLGLESVVGKRTGSVYEPGERSGAWIKHRTNREQDFVIGGYIPGAHGFDALLVGVYENKQLIFVAKGKGRLRAANSGRNLPGSPKAESCPLPVQKPAREKGIAVGRVANRRENGAMPLGHTEAGLPGAFVEWTDAGHLRPEKARCC